MSDKNDFPEILEDSDSKEFEEKQKTPTIVATVEPENPNKLVDGKKIYITGDTCLHKEEIERVADYEKIDVAISPINGAFGNMNEHDAVEMCKILKPQLYIPCHYWNFAEHGGNPGVMKTYFEKEFPEQKFDIMCMGEQVNIWLIKTQPLRSALLFQYMEKTNILMSVFQASWNRHIKI